MKQTRATRLERIANWGTALAVPLVALGGGWLLLVARQPDAPVADRGARPAGTPQRVASPPIDASAPPVVELHPAPHADPRCAPAPAPAARPAAERSDAPSPSPCPPR